MARQVLPIAGAVVGSFFGMPQLGFAIGSIIGNVVDPVQIQGPKIGDLQVQTSRDGIPRPIVFGKAAVMGNIIDRGEPRIVKKKERAGKGGPVTVTERAYISFAVRICEGPVAGVSRVWENEKLVYDGSAANTIPKDSAKFLDMVTIYLGGESQLPDPTLEAIHGVGSTPAHRGTCYAVFKNKDVTDTGGAIPQYRFEVNGGSYDSSQANVVSLLHFDGTNGSVVAFNDIVTSTGTMSPNTANNLSSTQVKFGSTSLQLSDVNAGTSPAKTFSSYTWAVDSLFTIEGWFYFVDYYPSERSYLLSMDINDYGIRLCDVEIKASTKYITLTGYGVTVNTAVTMPINSWTHMAVTYDGSTLRLFMNGALIASGACSLPSDPPMQVVAFYTTRRGTTTHAFFGYVDELRITHGVARYVSNFTPSNTAFFNP